MEQSEQITITILNWDKFQPRRDVFKHTWLRIDNDLPNDDKLYGLSNEQKWIWICLLCRASKEGSGTFCLKIEHFIMLHNIKNAVFSSAMSTFESNSMISLGEHGRVRARVDDRTCAYADVSTYIHTNIHTNTQTPHHPQAGDAHALIFLWNTNCRTLPKVAIAKIPDRRLKKINKLWPKFSETEWLNIINKITSSDFCLGSSGWKATFDWMLNETNIAKILEGNYDNPSMKDVLSERHNIEKMCSMLDERETRKE